MENQKEQYMHRAIQLAERGRGFTNPNPVVGAVVVKEGRIIGEGYHEQYGQLHAERNAFSSCKEEIAGADLYVTLEPCCHYGKTPPCTQAIIEQKIARVFIGSLDPNPLVKGKGVAALQAAGITVETGICKKECDEQNKIFFHYITHKTPYVIMKYAMTADGKIATYTGESQWITGEEARNRVHKQRGAMSAIMVGIGTVLADDPLLTCRMEGKRNPIRIICDSKLRIPLNSQIVQTASSIPTIIAGAFPQKEKEKALRKAGINVLYCAGVDGKIDLKSLMVECGRMNIDSILLEGGGELNESALKYGIVNRCEVYMASKILGGKDAKTPVEGLGVEKVTEAITMNLDKVSKVGEDLLLEFDIAKEDR